jgi:hypothetical protein
MPVIILRFENFKSRINARPECCPYCGCQLLQRWGAGSKLIQDTNQEVGKYHRYRCVMCGRTFRHYAAGVDKTRLTQRIRKIAGVAWALGLSAREVVSVFEEFSIELSYMTVWREGNAIVMRFKNSFGPDFPGRYSIDKLFLKNKGRGIGTSILVDLGVNKTIALGRMDVVDYRTVVNWLEPILEDLDIHISILGTDILFGRETTH